METMTASKFVPAAMRSAPPVIPPQITHEIADKHPNVHRDRYDIATSAWRGYIMPTSLTMVQL